LTVTVLLRHSAIQLLGWLWDIKFAEGSSDCVAGCAFEVWSPKHDALFIEESAPLSDKSRVADVVCSFDVVLKRQADFCDGFGDR
jgi:hypothetical protein